MAEASSDKVEVPQPSYVEALKGGTQKSYGARIKELLPPIAYSVDKPELQIKRQGSKVTASFLQETEPKLLDPFKWVLRGSFRRRRPSIKLIDEVITSNLSLSDSIQVAPYRTSEVMVRCLSEKDYTTILSKNAIKVGETQMRIFRWSPAIEPPWSYAALWFNIESLPPHLASPACLRELMAPWGTLFAVHNDVLYLTRPEITQVCLEVDLNQEWPTNLIINSAYGSFDCAVTAVQKPRWCKHCGLMGHTDEVCRHLLRWNKIRKSGFEPFRGKHSFGQDATWIPTKKKRKPMACSNCKKLGYDFCRCPFRKDGHEQEKAAPTKSGIFAEAKGLETLMQLSTKSHYSKEKGQFKEIGECSKSKNTSARATATKRVEKKEESSANLSSDNIERYDSCTSEQEDWRVEPINPSALPSDQDSEGDDAQSEPPPPAVSAIQNSGKKSKYGPLQWSSIAGDLHLNYKVWGALEVEDVQPERKPISPKKDIATDFTCNKVPKDPNFRCWKCTVAKVPQKGNLCRICDFQIPKRSRRKKSKTTHLRYDAKSENGLHTKEREDEWERVAKEEFQTRAYKCLQISKEVAGKKEATPPKIKWGDMTSDEEEPVEVQERQNNHEENPKGRGKKIKSRISTTEENEHRRTRSGRNSGQNIEGKREQWIEGIRLLKVNRYDQRHNATWQQWEVAPEMKINRREKKRLEDIAQRNENTR